MKKLLNLVIILCLCLSVSLRAFAQIPYYAGTVGDGKLYGYTSLKARPGINHQETYTTFQYGLGDHFATGIDLYTGPDCAYWGALVRYGVKLSQWFNVGAEVIPSFNLNDSFKFSYLTSGLYLNGEGGAGEGVVNLLCPEGAYAQGEQCGKDENLFHFQRLWVQR